MADLPTPHDALFRALLSDPERARDFLRDHLPNNIAGELADNLPEIIEGSFVDEALAGSQSDLLLKVRLATGGDAFVHVLAEHKSTPDPGLPLQLASYMVRIWKRHARASRALPPIIPLVVYHGADRWSVPDGLAGMMATDDPGLTFLPGERYILRNLRELEIHALSRNAGLRAGFITMRQEALAHLAEIAGSLPEGSDLRRQVLEYVLRVYNVELGELKTRLRDAGHSEPEALVGTIAETLIEQGEARGLLKAKVEGKAKGWAEGWREGKAEVLIHLLERRLGPLPGDIRNQIAASSVEQVETWIDTAIRALTWRQSSHPDGRAPPGALTAILETRAPD